jgi:glutamyl-Q tRNA(Asp) synthetase
MYIGRFAPSPTGPLHAGSLVAALASWLDARAHGGRWLVRMEDVDTPRTVHGAAEHILQQLQQCGLVPDEPVQWQSQRQAHYTAALAQLKASALSYPCYCSRKDIEAALQSQGHTRARHSALVYPGTCRSGSGTGTLPPAWRLRIPTPHAHVQWHDRRIGPQTQNVATEVGDFVLHRADGCTTYQLAVVVDDAAQGVTHVVRGQDLADNTARQIVLQQCLGLPTPHYLHTPLVLDAQGEKLSKQTGALAADTHTTALALNALNQAANCLGLPSAEAATALQDALNQWVQVWPYK